MLITYVYYADILTMDDLAILLNELNDVIDIWFRFGVQLRVPVSRLNVIKSENSNPDDCLMHMLIFWLTNTIPSPTWETVVDALCCAAIGRQQMADSIRRKYCNQDTGIFEYREAHVHWDFLPQLEFTLPSQPPLQTMLTHVCSPKNLKNSRTHPKVVKMFGWECPLFRKLCIYACYTCGIPPESNPV